MIHRYLDPDESLGELLFGLIMALTVTLGVRLLSSQDALKPHELAVALVGCNVAWGIIDAALYLLGLLSPAASATTSSASCAKCRPAPGDRGDPRGIRPR